MDTLLRSKPLMSPVSTISSTGKRTQSQSDESSKSDTSSGDGLDLTNENPSKYIINLFVNNFVVECFRPGPINVV